MKAGACPSACSWARPSPCSAPFAALWSRQMVNNVFAQIGLVMLIGLAAKNAILIVEFARLEYEKGKPLIEAALTGARTRLRPDPDDFLRVHPRNRALVDSRPAPERCPGASLARWSSAGCWRQPASRSA